MFRRAKIVPMSQERGRTWRLPKSLRNALISAGLLLVLFVSAGAAYTLIVDRNSAQNLSLNAKPVAIPVEPTVKPVKISPNAKESAAVEMITSPAAVGSNATATVQTNPASRCTIAVTYNNVASTDSGLVPKTADDYGTVSWTWTVPTSAPLGTWPVKITCVYNGRTAVVQADLQVTK